MTPDKAKSVARRIAVRDMRLGDRITTPRGEVLYAHAIEIPNQPVFVFLMDGRAIGVALMRSGARELRYCDPDGVIRKEPLGGHSVQEAMPIAINRMSALIRKFLGERHPLADAISANGMTA